MRRMRDSDWRMFRSGFIVIVVAVFFVAAVHGVTRRWKPGWAPGGWHSVRAHSRSIFAAGSSAPRKKSVHPVGHSRLTAKAAAVGGSSQGFLGGFFNRLVGAVKGAQSKITGKAAREAYSAIDALDSGKTSMAAGESVLPPPVAIPNTPEPEVPAGAEQAFAETEFGTAGDGIYCSAAEYRGPGIEKAGVSADDWKIQMSAFHAAKRDLLSWIGSYSAGMSPKLAQAMEAQVSELRIQRPPTTENPDLGWRGIGVLMRDSQNQLILRLGGGFPKLTARAPERARFELVRQMAQVWSPCELGSLAGEADSSKFWKPLLKCLGVDESQACEMGSYSEAGWAVSTAVAAVIAPPKCTVPVFRNLKYRACLEPLKAALAKAASGAKRFPASRAE